MIDIADSSFSTLLIKICISIADTPVSSIIISIRATYLSGIRYAIKLKGLIPPYAVLSRVFPPSPTFQRYSGKCPSKRYFQNPPLSFPVTTSPPNRHLCPGSAPAKANAAKFINAAMKKEIRKSYFADILLIMSLSVFSISLSSHDHASPDHYSCHKENPFQPYSGRFIFHFYLMTAHRK
ncbi:MAG: hypothetical protein BWY61_01899 [Firmicutes bacterium ADurb.Bin354]|nr:MAG: hypothetical protein BWY61_01899 [Firmicutes bacterium ADurb.Bin354]